MLRWARTLVVREASHAAIAVQHAGRALADRNFDQRVDLGFAELRLGRFRVAGRKAAARRVAARVTAAAEQTERERDQ